MIRSTNSCLLGEASTNSAKSSSSRPTGKGGVLWDIVGLMVVVVVVVDWIEIIETVREYLGVDCNGLFVKGNEEEWSQSNELELVTDTSFNYPNLNLCVSLPFPPKSPM